MKIKLENILNKLEKITYPIEFITSLFMSILFIQLFTTKQYSGFWHKGYLIGSILLAVITISVIIYHCIKHKDKIEKMFLNFVIPISLLFLIFMIPGQIPDELAHMIRTYEVSEGKLFTPKDENNETTTMVPKALLKCDQNQLNKYSILKQKIQEETNYSDRIKTVSSAQGYSFILYLFSSVGFVIGRILNLNILYGIYIGKIFNILLYLIVGYLAIKKIPFGKKLLAIYLMMPMFIHQMVSFSADVVVNMISIYFIANLLHLLVKEEDLTKKDGIIYCILTALLGMAKMAYIPLVGIGILFITRKNTSKKKKTIFITASIIIGLIFSVGSYLDTMRCNAVTDWSKEYNERLNVSSSEQIKTILNEPKKVVKAFYTDWTLQMPHYIEMAIGSNLGWLNIEPNRFVIMGYMILLLAAIVYENHKYSLKLGQKLWILLIAIGTIIMIEASLYVAFTPVGAEFIGGIQGRYFIPIFILGLLCMCQKDNYLKGKFSNTALTLISFVLNLSVLNTIYHFFI